MTPILLTLSVPVSAAALLVARWEYRRRGRLSPFGLFLLCTMLLVPNLAMHFVARYEMPASLLDFVGVAVASIGLVLCFFAIFAFRSISKMMCLGAGQLTRSGTYRWSRNPQYVGWLVFLFGFAVLEGSAWCLAALGVVAISLHLLILIEEEHLRRVFGDAYERYRRSVPRYLGRARSPEA